MPSASLLCALLSTAGCMNALADIEIGNTVEARIGGYDNVDFGDSFYGFCIEKSKDGAAQGSSITVEEAQSNIKNNATGNDVSNHIKIFFVEYFQEIFDDGNVWFYGEYKKDAAGNFKVPDCNFPFVAAVIWNLTDNYEPESEALATEVTKAVKKITELADAGLEIPDSGYIRTYEVVW